MRDTRIWEVGMKKKLILIMALLCCLVLVVGILAACNGDEGTQPGGQTPGNSSAYAGRYYEQVNGNLNADSWIELDDDWSWTDSDTMMGTFTVKGSNIYFYWMTTSEPMFGGTISNGELTIDLYGTYYTYKQGTPSVDKPGDPDKEDPDDEKPEEPEEPEEEYFTVTFNVNGGDSAISSREYLAGALMSLPTPTRDGYRFLGWYDAMGWRYDNTSVMPDNDLTLTARWEIVVSSYEDEYVYFKPATEGKKQPNNFYYPFQDAGIHHYIYVELESDNIGGPNAVGDKNNLDLASRVDMEFSVEDGYTLTWYNDSSFTSINGAQMFTLGYGSNVYFLTVSEGTRVVQRYLIDFYIKHDYYISLYSNIYATRPYTNVRVHEGDTLSQNISHSSERDFEFDKWVYYNEGLDEFVEFDFDTEIREDGALYQTFAPYEITPELDGGSLDEELTLTPYTTYQQLPIPTKEGYDFIGWQLADGGYFADITGYGSTIVLSDDNYFTSLKAEFRPKKYYKYVTNAGDTVAFVDTVPVVFYTDEHRVEIYEIYYIPAGQLPYCPVPGAVPSDADEIFRGWRTYDGTANAKAFDFNEAIDEPMSVFPELHEASLSSDIGIGKGYSFRSGGLNLSYSAAVWLPSTAAYTLTVSGKASISVAAYAGNAAANYTSTSSRSVKIIFQGNNPSGMYAYVTLTQTSGTVSLTLTGATGYSDQSKKIDPVTAEYGEFGQEVLLEARENIGGTFLGWYDEDDVKVSGEAKYDYAFTMPNNEVTYTAKWARTSIVSGDTSKGTVSSLTGTYLPGDTASVTATTKSGYTFIGWYNGDEKLTGNLTYEFTMPAENVTYTAKWIKVTVESEDTTKGTVSSLTGTYLPGDTASVTATTNPGYTFIGWYNGDKKLTDRLTYEFTMPANEVTYTAKWEMNPEMEPFVFTSTPTSLTITGVTDKGVTSLDVPSYVTKIDAGAFKGCDSLENITLPFVGETKDGAENTHFGYIFGASSYEGHADYVPASLKEVTITGGTSIGNYAFAGCSGLTSVTIPDSVTSIGQYAFKACTAEIIWGDVPKIMKIGDYAFSGYKGTSITIPDSVTNIGQYAFEGCTAEIIWGENPRITEIGSCAFYRYEGTSITIPDSVTSIGSDAFGDCDGLTSITIPDSVRSIGEAAFDYCSGLTSVTIGSGVTSIGNSAFSDCSGLTSIIIPDSVRSIGEGAFDGCYALVIYCEAASRPGGWYSKWNSSSCPVVWDCNNNNKDEDGYEHVAIDGWQYALKDGNATVKRQSSAITGSIDIPASVIYDGKIYSVTSIGEDAFYNCSGLTSITIPDSVTSIGSGAFDGCSSLTSVTIPDGVTSIGSYAFRGCTSLTSVTIPDSVTSIGSYAFTGCTSGIVWGDEPEITKISSYAFSGYKGTSITIPDSVTSIGESAFSGCSSLESITIPFVGATKDGTRNTHFGYIFGATRYNNNAERVPASLKEVIITGGTSIGSYAFSGCSGLTSITIGNSVTSIGYSAFEGCSSLESITIPFVGATKDGTSDTHFGYIFGASSSSNNDDYVPASLKEVIITGGTNIGWSAFEDCSGLTSITIPDGVTSIERWAFSGCSGIIEVVDGIRYVDSWVVGAASDIKITLIKQGTRGIADYAFYYCSGLTSITIPDSVTSIGYSAFEGCGSLESITIPFVGTHFGYIFGAGSYSDNAGYVPASLKEVIITGGTSIGSSAFYNCSGLTSITIPDSVTSIGNYAFSGCSGLTSVTIGNSVTSIGYEAFKDCSGLASVIIPDSVMSIGGFAFSRCSKLTSVTIGNSVTSIGVYAFYYCTGLTSINYEGTMAQWNKISENTNWAHNSYIKKVVCTDGTVNV